MSPNKIYDLIPVEKRKTYWEPPICFFYCMCHYSDNLLYIFLFLLRPMKLTSGVLFLFAGMYDGNEHTPKLLQCSHTVCLHCLTRIAASQTRDTGSFRCPICRELITIPRGGVSALPPSFLVNQLLDLMSRQRREVNLYLVDVKFRELDDQCLEIKLHTKVNFRKVYFCFISASCYF